MIQPHEFIGQAVETEHGPVLTPAAVQRLLEELTDAEAAELMEFASAEGSDQFSVRASAWLIRRFNIEWRKRQ